MRIIPAAGFTFLTLVATPAFASGSHYGLTISNGATQNVSFSGGVFTATADNAVLNADDLENALASGSVTVTTGNGSGGTHLGDLHVEVALSWTATNGLTLDAYHSIFVDQPISVAGPGALTLTDNDGGKGGDLIFRHGGKAAFLSTANSLTIDGQAYKLESTIASLLSDIIANYAGYYALAADYDASADGTYTSVPIAPGFEGEMEGLGNSIANLTIDDSAGDRSVGLFSTVMSHHGKRHPFPGVIRDLTLANVNIQANASANIGGLAGTAAVLLHDRVTGTIVGGTAHIGGLAGTASRVMDCSTDVAVAGGKRATAGGLLGVFSTNHVLQLSRSSGSVKGGQQSTAGGLVGDSAGRVETSFSTASISTGSRGNAGGLIGVNNGALQNTFASGPVTSGKFGNAGGVIGSNANNGVDASVILSYGSGLVSGGTGSFTGGFVGEDQSQGSIRAVYWDTTSSSQSQGAGNIDEGGMTGLTTAQLQAGLPAGFSKKIWAQSPDINNGLPYLIDNPPQ